MTIPKSVEDLIKKRAQLGADLNSADYELSVWLQEHNVKVEDYDVFGGCELLANPFDSANRIRKAIKEATPTRKERSG